VIQVSSEFQEGANDNVEIREVFFDEVDFANESFEKKRNYFRVMNAVCKGLVYKNTI